MGHSGHDGGLGMALRVLAHMPWYQYALMAAAAFALAVVVHLRIRRRYWPQHATMEGITRNTVQHAAILAGAELLAILAVIAVVAGGILAYHLV